MQWGEITKLVLFDIFSFIGCMIIVSVMGLLKTILIYLMNNYDSDKGNPTSAELLCLQSYYRCFRFILKLYSVVLY